ncbi:hypothetical protein A2U01_0072788, partial [Trifolium medium]|nr:hypothetical protein [Trifolium medium]
MKQQEYIPAPAPGAAQATTTPNTHTIAPGATTPAPSA